MSLFYIKLSMDYVTSISILTLIFLLMLIIIHLGNMMIYLLRRNMQELIPSNTVFFKRQLIPGIFFPMILVRQ